MIKTEHPYNENEALIRTYSDEGFKIRQEETGQYYDDAVDVFPCRYTYTETDIPVPVTDEPEAEEVVTEGIETEDNEWKTQEQ